MHRTQSDGTCGARFRFKPSHRFAHFPAAQRHHRTRRMRGQSHVFGFDVFAIVFVALAILTLFAGVKTVAAGL